MGARSNTETPLRLLAALLEQPTWTQAELARRVGAHTDVQCVTTSSPLGGELGGTPSAEAHP
jgi:hypothetical protein